MLIVISRDSIAAHSHQIGKRLFWHTLNVQCYDRNIAFHFTDKKASYIREGIA